MGEISEAAVIFRSLEKGYAVSKPIGENQKYDLLLDMDNKIQRVQVKTARMNGGALTATATSTIRQAGGKYKRIKYKISDIDLFAVYSPDLKKIYMIPATNSYGSNIVLRTEAPKNNQIAKVKWAKDFEF